MRLISAQKISFVGLFALFIAFQGVAWASTAAVVSCKKALKESRAPRSVLEQQMREALAEELSPDGDYEKFREKNKQTLVFDGFTPDGRLRFYKKSTDHWMSYKILFDGMTNQGDLRWPIALYGPKISLYLGFEIQKMPNGDSILIAPSAKYIAKKIDLLNVKLLEAGLKPIPFLPIETGFLDDRQIVSLSVNALDGVHMTFPYAVKIPRLAPHEVGFHLGDVMFPPEVFERARWVNIRLLQMVGKIEKDDVLKKLKITERLLHDRAVELDIGTASSSFFGLFRIEFSGKPFAEIARNKKFRDNLSHIKIAAEDRLGYLAKSHGSPVEAILYQLFMRTGVGHDLISDIVLRHPQVVEARSDQTPEKFQLNEFEKQRLLVLMSEFKEKFLAEDARFSFAPMLTEFNSVSGYMDQRQAEIETAIEAIYQLPQ